jgi:hypothetical protein
MFKLFIKELMSMIGMWWLWQLSYYCALSVGNAQNAADDLKAQYFK